MIAKRLLDESRLRTIPRSYGWADHRLLREKFLVKLDVQSIALYFFLILAGDSRGLSYYGDKTVCSHLNIPFEKLYQSRMQLINNSLIAYEPPLYQVLSLPSHPMKVYAPSRTGQAALGQIMAEVLQKGSPS